MKIILPTAILLSFVFILGNKFYNENLTLSLTNNSSQELILDHVLVHFYANTLSIDKDVIKPGEMAVVTGTTTQGFDLSGVIYFKNDTQLRVKNPRQFHMGQPIFQINSSTIESTIESRVRNPVVAPRSILYTEVTIRLKDKL